MVVIRHAEDEGIGEEKNMKLSVNNTSQLVRKKKKRACVRAAAVVPAPIPLPLRCCARRGGESSLSTGTRSSLGRLRGLFCGVRVARWTGKLLPWRTQQKLHAVCLQPVCMGRRCDEAPVCLGLQRVACRVKGALNRCNIIFLLFLNKSQLKS